MISMIFNIEKTAYFVPIHSESRFFYIPSLTLKKQDVMCTLFIHSEKQELESSVMNRY